MIKQKMKKLIAFPIYVIYHLKILIFKDDSVSYCKYKMLEFNFLFLIFLILIFILQLKFLSFFFSLPFYYLFFYYFGLFLFSVFISKCNININISLINNISLQLCFIEMRTFF